MDQARSELNDVFYNTPRVPQTMNLLPGHPCMKNPVVQYKENSLKSGLLNQRQLHSKPIRKRALKYYMAADWMYQVSNAYLGI